MNTPASTNQPLINALKAHFFDLAKREQVGKTGDLSAEADATEKLIAMLDKKCKADSARWTDEPLNEGWHWLKYQSSRMVVLVRKVADELMVHTISTQYSPSDLPGARYCGPIQPPA